jgi:hypothetical protein
VTPGEPVPCALGSWLEQRTARAPEALRRRVVEYAGRAAAGSSIAVRLAAAGQAALERALEHSGDRSAALDLLAADALVTLALLAQSEQGADGLAAFAEEILQAQRPGS